MKPKHYSNIDFMRILSAFAVVMIHVISPIIGQEELYHSQPWWYACIVVGIFRFGPPIFMMISGALLINKVDLSAPLSFLKRFKRIFLMTATWTAVYCAWNYFYKGLQLPFSYYWDKIITGLPYYHLWYLYTFIGLFLLTPLLAILWNKWGNRKMLFLTGVCFSASAVNYWLLLFTDLGFQPRIFLFKWWAYLGYYFAGKLIFDAIQANRTPLSQKATWVYNPIWKRRMDLCNIES